MQKSQAAAKGMLESYFFTAGWAATVPTAQVATLHEGWLQPGRAQHELTPKQAHGLTVIQPVMRFATIPEATI